MTSPVIQLHHWEYSVGERQILNPIQLDLYAGEFVTVVGPNGAGKTTLLKTILKLTPGAKGSLAINGVPHERLKQRDRARMISYVPQMVRQSLPFTVFDFVCMGRYPYSSAFSSLTQKDFSIVDQALQVTNMVPFKNRQMDTLSGGERQKALLAAALAQESQALFLDEPTAFLDPRQVDDMYGLLHRLHRDQGKTIFMITHDINHAAMISDRILALKAGSVVFDGDPTDFMCIEVLSDLFEKNVHLIPQPDRPTPLMIADWGNT